MTLKDDPQIDPSELERVSRTTFQRDAWREKEEIRAAVKEMEAKVWYDRHRLLMEERRLGSKPLPADAMAKADSTARKIEETYGKGNLGPYSDFEWGMLNGKLSALRWVLGEEWDSLDT